MSVADPGLDRLCCALAATGATVPVRLVSLDAPEALALSAPEPPQSIAAVGRAVYWSIRSALEQRGVSMPSASAVGLRAARGVVLELAGLSRRELVSALGVSGRTVERDRELLRAIGPNSLDGGEFFPRVPASARRAADVAVGRAGAARGGLRGVRAGVGQRWSAGGVP